MTDAPRYRMEGDAAIVDVRVPIVDRLFDNRDPAPFRQRDLDPALVEYLVGAAHDVARLGDLRLVFWIDGAFVPEDVERGVRSHFAYELDRGSRRRREQVSTGWIALLIAAVLVVALVGLSQVVARIVPGTLGAGLKEALVISGWVLLWRPVELLIYDGIPWRRERRALRALHRATIEIRDAATATR